MWGPLRRTSMPVLVVALAATASGCFNTPVKNGQVACGPDDLCPDGFECVVGLCRLPGTAPDDADAAPKPDGSMAIDGGMGDGGMMDASFPMGPFSSVTAIGGVPVTGYTEYSPSMTDDGLELYMQTVRTSDGAPFIIVSKRDDPADPWNPPTDTLVAGPSYLPRDPLILPDGLTMYFSANNGTSYNVYRAHRADRASAWDSVVMVATPISQTGSNDYGPCIAPDELTMIFPSDRGGAFHLWRSTRANTGAAWGTPVELTGIETDNTEQDCWLASDESELFFGSDRSGGTGTVNIYHADGDGNGGYSNVTEVSELNASGTASYHPFLTPDRHTILFNRDGVLYSATR